MAVDKSVTIKGATDDQLDSLLVRLRKENELQYLISDIKRKSAPAGSLSYDTQVSTEEPIETLYHYGVMGMHWGKRKGGSGRIDSPSTKLTSEEHAFMKSIKNKKVHELTNAELKKFNERTQLEKQFKELTKKQPSAAKKLVSELLSNVGKQAVKTYLNGYMQKKIDSALKKTAGG